MSSLYALLCAVAAAMLAATIAVTGQARTLVIARVNVVDVVNGQITTNSTVTISGQTIVRVAEGEAPPAGADIVDGQGKFLIPGLWDMHAHVLETWLPLYVANGVTAIRDMGNDLDDILRLRDATATGLIVGPRIFAAGPILDDAPADWPLRMRVRNAEEATAAVQLLKRRGVDLIKVHNFTPRDAFFAIASEARRQGLPFASHVPLKVTVQEAIDAGITSIEHFSEDGRVWRECSGSRQYNPDACRSFFEMLAEKRVWQTPTLMAISEIGTIGTTDSRASADQMAYASAAVKEMWRVGQSMLTPAAILVLRGSGAAGPMVARDMARAGVGILAGCDALVAGFCLHDELEAMVRGGMTPLEALRTATINPARYFGIEATAGRVATGQSADAVLLDANPLTDITNVRQIRAVVREGQLLDRAALDDILARARAEASAP